MDQQNDSWSPGREADTSIAGVVPLDEMTTSTSTTSTTTTSTTTTPFAMAARWRKEGQQVRPRADITPDATPVIVQTGITENEVVTQVILICNIIFFNISSDVVTVNK